MRKMKFNYTVIFFLLLVINPSLSIISYSNSMNKESKDELLRKGVIKRFHLTESASYYKVKGQHYKFLRKFKNAIQNYEYALLIDNNCGICYFALGEIYYRQKLYQESIVNLKMAENKYFEYTYDRIRAKYLLAIDYFYQKKNKQALSVLEEIIREYQGLIDKTGYNIANIRTEYYAPAFFLINLDNYHRHKNDQDAIYLTYLQKNLELNYNKEFVNYFLYSYYKQRNILNLAFEYLTQAKILDPEIENKIKILPWVKNYDIFNYMVTQ